MRILLVQNSLYYPAYGGGNKSNRLLLEELVARGHQCRVVTRVSETLDPERFRLFLADLESRGIEIRSSSHRLVVFQLNGVEVHTETSVHRVRDHLVRQMREFDPDWTLISTDDPLQLFLSAAIEHDPSRVVYLARASLALPFGPDTALGSEQRTANLRRVAGIVAVSHYVKRYIEEWGGMKAEAMPISLHGKGEFPRLGAYDNKYVTMVNPCGIKGISIFSALARAFPEQPFAAVPMWGTNEDDLQELEQLRNVELLPPVDDINKILAKTRVLLAPSLCNDAKPRIVFESLSRGVPVLAADVGGVSEAMLGLDYLLPVSPVERYEAQMDSQMVPKAVIPEQDAVPWKAALERLLSDREHYEDLASRGFDAAAHHVSEITIEPFEQFLEELAERAATSEAKAEDATAKPDPLAGLSAEKRALLLKRIRSQRKPD